MTPTATVCFKSLAAKRPRRERVGGKKPKLSTLEIKSVHCDKKPIGRLTKRRVGEEALHTHGLDGDQRDCGSVSRQQHLRLVLQLLACATVKLLLQLGKATSHVSGVAVQDWRVACSDLPWMVQDDHLENRLEKMHINSEGGKYMKVSVLAALNRPELRSC